MANKRLNGVSWVADVAELIAAGGVGSLLTQFGSRSSERRALRAKVREELSIVEALRWASKAEIQKRNTELLSARRRLHTAALLAHPPRELIETYDQLALAAFKSSRERLEATDEARCPVPSTSASRRRTASCAICYGARFSLASLMGGNSRNSSRWWPRTSRQRRVSTCGGSTAGRDLSAAHRSPLRDLVPRSNPTRVQRSNSS
jgi:hypothetical protein